MPPVNRFVCRCLLTLALTAAAPAAHAQNWSFDARDIALGGIGGTPNIARKMIGEQRAYRSIVVPFGLLQVLQDLDVFDPNAGTFDPVRAIESAIAPLHWVMNRAGASSAQARFSSDIRNATLSRDLSVYQGFTPAPRLLAEGLAAPGFGHTFRVRTAPGGGYQGLYVGAGPYVSMHTSADIGEALIDVLETGVNLPNARLPLSNRNEAQMALAVTGGYRGRFTWADAGARDGVYVGASYHYLRGFRYEAVDLRVTLDTDQQGLVAARPNTTPVVLARRYGTAGTGRAVDVGVGVVMGPWEAGFGANGLGNRVDWDGVDDTRYALASLTSGDSEFTETRLPTSGTVSVELPVNYRANLAFETSRFTAAMEVGRGFGGAAFHGGIERRLGPIELRGGARYTVEKWNPTGGIGIDLSERLSIDVAAFGSHANIQRTRQTALAVSLRFNRRR